MWVTHQGGGLLAAICVSARWYYILRMAFSESGLILSPLPLTGGTALTAKYAEEEGAFISSLSPGFESSDLRALHSFLADREFCKLNVAGPRLSQWPDSRDFVKRALDQIFELSG